MNKIKKACGFLLVLAISIATAISPATTVNAATPKLNKTTLNLTVGQTFQLKLKKVKTKKLKKTKYVCSKKSVATVSAQGLITANNSGTATITCKATLTSGKKYNLKCNLTVTPKANPSTVVVSSDRYQMIHDMGHGINLGNTMEACGDWINNSSVSNYEKAWGSTLIEKKTIQGYADAGFKTLRIPVAWSNMMADDGKYTINPDYLSRVDQIVNWALDADLYVVLNIHYDNGWWARFGSQDSTERAEAMKKYKSIWTQLANHYKDYSSKLIFESANEELGGRLNSIDDYKNSGYFKSENEIYDAVNKINQAFIDIVRSSGSNNSDRYVLIAGYNTNVAQTCDSRFHMPKDTVDGRMFISVHYYSGSKFDSTTSEAERNSAIAAFKTSLNSMKNCFVNKGIPVIIGEYGVDVLSGATKDDMYYHQFFKEVLDYSLNNGICPLLWSTPDFIYDRVNAKIPNKTIASTYADVTKNLSNYKIYVPSSTSETNSYLWEGKLGLSGWCITPSEITGDATFNLDTSGNVYTITGVDWDNLKKPILEISGANASGSSKVRILFAVKVNNENPYWLYIENTGDIYKDINIGDKYQIDLSSLNLSGNQTLYMSFVNAEQMSGKFTITIK